MNELSSVIPWAEIPLYVLVIGLLLARAWKSRELVELRARVVQLDEALFDEMRRHAATRRALADAREELECLEILEGVEHENSDHS